MKLAFSNEQYGCFQKATAKATANIGSPSAFSGAPLHFFNDSAHSPHYNSAMRTAILLSISLSLVACSDGAPRDPQAAKDKRAGRIVKAQSAVSVTPTPRNYHFDGSELKVVDVPVMDASGFVDLQHCFIWRDAEFKTSSISCPAEQTRLAAKA